MQEIPQHIVNKLAKLSGNTKLLHEAGYRDPHTAQIFTDQDDGDGTSTPVQSPDMINISDWELSNDEDGNPISGYYTLNGKRQFLSAYADPNDEYQEYRKEFVQ